MALRWVISVDDQAGLVNKLAFADSRAFEDVVDWVDDDDDDEGGCCDTNGVADADGNVDVDDGKNGAAADGGT
jgi:hypothetical protein